MKIMNGLVFLILFCVLGCGAQTQSTSSERKFIEVTGSAEMTVLPDKVELEIALIEFYDNTNSIKMSAVKEKLKAVLKKNNVAEDRLSFESSHNQWYWWSWWQSYRHGGNRRTLVNLSLDSTTDFLELVKDLNKRWVQSIRIVKTSNKDIQKLRKEVKKEAMRAAKEKATYLLESIDEEIGGVLSVEELSVQNAPSQPYWYYNQNQNINQVSNSVISSNTYTPSSQNRGIGNVNEIKLRYEIKAKFEIL
jgi:uncharacterized protein YggE